jgi:hypothetical protein
MRCRTCGHSAVLERTVADTAHDTAGHLARSTIQVTNVLQQCRRPFNLRLNSSSPPISGLSDVIGAFVFISDQAAPLIHTHVSISTHHTYGEKAAGGAHRGALRRFARPEPCRHMRLADSRQCVMDHSRESPTSPPPPLSHWLKLTNSPAEVPPSARQVSQNGPFVRGWGFIVIVTAQRTLALSSLCTLQTDHQLHYTPRPVSSQTTRANLQTQLLNSRC